MNDPNNLIITLGNLATFLTGIQSYVGDAIGAIPVMNNDDTDSMMTRVLGGSINN